VALAKRLVKSVVDIDSEAGPSEVVVIADERANPACVAAEMIAQAEHDEEATSILLDAVKKPRARGRPTPRTQAAAQPRRAIIEQSLSSRGLAIVVRDIEEAIRLSDLIAPEHLSIQTEFRERCSTRCETPGPSCSARPRRGRWAIITRAEPHFAHGPAGAVLIALTAEDFRKVTSVIGYSQERLRRDAEDICTLARAEGLEAHAAAVEVRL